jgi:hypothetical protein
MALLFIDSFDHYETATMTKKWTSNASGVIGSWGRRSSKGLRFTGANQTAKVVLQLPAPTDSRTVMGFAFKITGDIGSGTGSNYDIVQCHLINGSQWSLRMNNDGKLYAHKGNFQSGVILGSTATSLSENVWHFVELDVVIHPTAGTFKVWVDGILRLNLSSVDTRAQGSNAWDSIQLGGLGSLTFYFDDLYIADGTGSGLTSVTGDVQAEYVVPDANGTTRQWLRSSGSDDYTLVDEAVPDTADYLYTSTLDDIVTMNFPVAPLAGANIAGIQLVSYAQRTSAAAAGLKHVTRQGGTNYVETAEHGLTDSTFLYHREPQDLQPDGSGVWTETAFGNAEFGVKKSL